MDKVHLVDLLVWGKKCLLPTKPRLSLRTGFKGTNCSDSPTFGHAPNTRLMNMHKIPNPGSKVVVVINTSFNDSIWRQRLAEYSL